MAGTSRSDPNGKTLVELLTSSPAALVASIYTSLTTRPRLCDICQSTSRHVSEFLLSFEDHVTAFGPGIGWCDWPPRDISGGAAAAYMDGLRFLPPEDVKPDDGPLPANVIQHHARPRDLLISARSCALCEIIRIALIMDCFREREFPFDTATAPFKDVILNIMIGVGKGPFIRIMKDLQESKEPLYLLLDESRSFKRGGCVKPGFKLDFIRLIWKRHPPSISEKGRAVVFTRLNVFTSVVTGGPKSPSHISTRLPLRSSCSTDALDLMRNWYRKCRTHHNKCRGTTSRGQIAVDELHSLPLRVIDVGPRESTNDPRLVDTTGFSKGHWVALSHCWGDLEFHPLKTTRANVNEHMRSIPFSTLPKTFVDAIVVTRALSLRYLWIDSLCIIQDDEEDWRTQSREMGVIYEHAVLTVAASWARNSSEGLFIQRDYGPLQVPVVQLPLTREGKVLGHYNVGIEWRQEPFIMPMDPYFTQLSTRGWATQEWILSRRIIHFLDRGMVWICKSHAEDEAGQMIAGRGLPEGEWCTEWGKLVVEHSARRFTYPKDKLISLEGIAREIGKTKALMSLPSPGKWVHNDTYAFGVYEIDVPEFLVWTPLVQAKKLDMFPSWSWASHDGPIFMRFRDFDNHRQDSSFISECKVLGMDSITGVLGIRAKRPRVDHLLGAAVPRGDCDDNDLYYRGTYHSHFSLRQGSQPAIGWAFFDDGRVHDKSEELFFLHIATAEYYSEPHIEYYGILLARARGRDEETFERVGLAATWDNSWMEDAPKIDTKLM